MNTRLHFNLKYIAWFPCSLVVPLKIIIHLYLFLGFCDRDFLAWDSGLVAWIQELASLLLKWSLAHFGRKCNRIRVGPEFALTWFCCALWNINNILQPVNHQMECGKIHPCWSLGHVLFHMWEVPLGDLAFNYDMTVWVMSYFLSPGAVNKFEGELVNAPCSLTMKLVYIC